MSTQTFNTKAEWLAHRRNGIGASEVSAALIAGESGLGLSPYVSRYTLWAQKAGVIEPSTEETEAMRIGTALEDPICRMFVQREAQEGRSARIVNDDRLEVFTHDVLPWLFATPDRIVQIDGALHVLEAKFVSGFAQGWDGNEPPVYMRFQLQAQMMCTGIPRGILVALDGAAAKLRIWRATTSEKLAAIIEQQTELFWSLVRDARKAIRWEDKAALHAIELQLGVCAKDLPTIQALHLDDDGSRFECEQGTGQVDEWIAHNVQRLAHEKAEDEAKARVLHAAGDASEIWSGGRMVASRTKSGAWRLSNNARHSAALALSVAEVAS